MKSIKALKKLVLAVVFVGFLALLLGYCLRHALWQQKPSIWKGVGAEYLIITGELRGLMKDEVTSKLGPPYKQSARYALLRLRENSHTSGMTADLVITLDAKNHVTEIAHAWKDFSPVVTNRYDPQRWLQSDNHAKIGMTSDLVRRWRGGAFREEFHSLSKLEECLGSTRFVDEWHYLIGEWTALMVEFDREGKVADASVVDFD